MGDIFSNDFETYVLQILNKQYTELLVLGQDVPPIKELYDNFLEACGFLKKLQITDTEISINEALKNNKKVLAEAAQATLLDIDHGTSSFLANL